MNLPPEFIKYLQAEITHFDKELISILELPNVKSLRDRIKKDKRDIEDMLNFSSRIENTNALIRLVKDEIRACNDKAMALLGHRLQRVKRKYERRDTSYDL